MCLFFEYCSFFHNFCRNSTLIQNVLGFVSFLQERKYRIGRFSLWNEQLVLKCMAHLYVFLSENRAFSFSLCIFVSLFFTFFLVVSPRTFLAPLLRIPSSFTIKIGLGVPERDIISMTRSPTDIRHRVDTDLPMACLPATRTRPIDDRKFAPRCWTSFFTCMHLSLCRHWPGASSFAFKILPWQAWLISAFYTTAIFPRFFLYST